MCKKEETVKVIKLKEGEYTLDELAVEMAKRLDEMSYAGRFKIHARAIEDLYDTHLKYFDK